MITEATLRQIVIDTLRQNISDVAVWYDKTKQGYVAELTRELAMQITSKLAAACREANVTFKTKTELFFHDDTIISVRSVITLGATEVEGIGECERYIRVVDEVSGEITASVNSNAFRTAETRAFKRALEQLVSDLGVILRKYSQAITYVSRQTRKQDNESYQQYVERLKKLVRSDKQLLDRIFGEQT